ncbi:hypothetical protein, partial [Bacillus thuringiensis]|uniref:hypothetical protein n=1 Tax=Bacillus thuringiensis TaxID=1428 RepID=UPI00285267C1
EKFLNPSVEVHFYEKEERQKMDCFDDKTEVEGWKAALEEHGKCIQMFRRTHSNRTRTEFLALD